MIEDPERNELPEIEGTYVSTEHNFTQDLLGGKGDSEKTNTDDKIV